MPRLEDARQPLLDLLRKPEIGGDQNMNLLLVGCGPYARAAYLPMIRLFRGVLRIRLCGVVEQPHQIADTMQQLHALGLENVEMLSATDSDLMTRLDQLQQKMGVNACIVSTPPETHAQYAKFTLERGITTLLDKPVVTRHHASTDPTQAAGILQDYENLARLYVDAKAQFPNLHCMVKVQRRWHDALADVRSSLIDVYQRTGQLPSHISIQKADGQWRLPSELHDESYHGFNHGVGILSHTGYHIFDVVAQILAPFQASDRPLTSVQVYSSFTRPSDIVGQLSESNLAQLFGVSSFGTLTKDARRRLGSMGEVDASIHCTFFSGSKKITQVTINLLHTSLSARTWSRANPDLYQGNGREKRETWDIEQGPFQRLTFSAGPSFGRDDTSVLHISRNPLVADNHGKPANRRKTYGKSSWMGVLASVYAPGKVKVDSARAQGFGEFGLATHGYSMDGGTSSDLLTHYGTNTLMSAAYLSGAREYCGENPLITVPYHQNFEILK